MPKVDTIPGARDVPFVAVNGRKFGADSLKQAIKDAKDSGPRPSCWSTMATSTAP